MAKWTRRNAALGTAIASVVAAASLVASTAAHAGFIPGHIDPVGTGTVPGFTGDVVFSIDDSILSLGDGWHATPSSGPCSAACVYSADINLYSPSPLDPPVPGTILGTFSLSEPPNTWPVLGVLLSGGAVIGVDTDPMGPEDGTGMYASDEFWLQFVSGACPSGICSPPGNFFVDPAYIYELIGSTATISNPGTVTFGPACADPANCVVAAAPEPGTLGLLLGALGGGWIAKRRKRKTES